jgi:predicted DNA-binding transcriptional regulator AlpA
MRYRVVVTVELNAQTAEAAEREALKAIVSDIAGWSKGVILVKSEVVEEPLPGELLSVEQVATLTGLRAERILEIAGGPLFPPATKGKWKKAEIEQWIRDLPEGYELALDDE